MKISVIIPTTCSRLDLLTNMLWSLYQTTEGYNIETILVVDEKDDILHVEGVSILRDYVFDFSRARRGALFCWNRGLRLSTGDIIVPAGDDQLFYSGWLDYALESHKNRVGGYGVIGMNDLAYNGDTQVATMFLFDRHYCKAFMGGVFAPPHYHYYCIDSEWNEKAKLYGRFYWDDRSKVEHVHSAHGKRPVDSLDQEKVDAGFLEHDTEIFQERMRKDFPVDYPSII